MHHLRAELHKKYLTWLLAKLAQSIMDQIVGKKGASFTMNFIYSLHKTIFTKKASYHKERQSKFICYSNIILLHVQCRQKVQIKH